jgi:hypothetical protein
MLYFPGGNTPPRFEWVRIIRRQYEDGQTGDVFDWSQYIGPLEFPELLVDECGEGMNGVQGRVCARVPSEKINYFQIHPDSSSLLAATSNIALRRFTRSTICTNKLIGPILFFRTIQDGRSPPIIYDIDMRDIRTAADGICRVGRFGVDLDFLKDQYVLATVIHSDIDVRQGKPKWNELVLDGCDDILGACGSMIANALGIPIQVRTKHFTDH